MTNFNLADPMLPAKMQMLGEFSRKMHHSQLNNGVDVVDIVLNLFRANSDTIQIEAIMDGYADVLSELVPRMVEKLPYPLVFGSQQELEDFENVCAARCTETCDYLRAILEGTHHFCEVLAKNPCPESLEGEELAIYIVKNARYEACGTLRLYVQHPQPGINIVDMAFNAVLFDLHPDAGGEPYAIDFDPRPTNNPSV